ncbi:dTMP kinase [Thiospirillum jenense]|uniref:dTMP kinase n=1 Tax=Thiospirillum jenense TaxID=1653858 RepID=UPI0030B800BA
MNHQPALPYGRLITLEGIEGAGKTTQRDVICETLIEQRVPFLKTREPGGSDIAERMRALLLDQANQGMSATAELLLMFAARAEHLHKTILPALSSGTWVICDRFTDASYAYQGGGRGIDAQHIRHLENWVQDGLRPHLTLLFDLPPTVGLARAQRRATAATGHPDRFELETVAFFERVRSVYLTLAEQDQARFRVIDATQPQAAVTAQVQTIIISQVNELRQGSWA